MKKTLLSTALLGLALSSTSVMAAEWTYEGDHGAEHWGDTFATCGEGKNQTPININQAVDADLRPLDIQYQGSVTGLINNGHTVQSEISGFNSLLVDGKTFDLKQFHFHTPSENYIKNRQYPLEAHFVHADEAGNLAVVAVMYEFGDKRDANLTKLLADIPGSKEGITLASQVKLSDLLPDTEHYYRFTGSLTTPPCSEGVRWFVLQEPVQASKKQLSSLHEVMGDNNRPLQPINSRLVVEK